MAKQTLGGWTYSASLPSKVKVFISAHSAPSINYPSVPSAGNHKFIIPRPTPTQNPSSKHASFGSINNKQKRYYGGITFTPGSRRAPNILRFARPGRAISTPTIGPRVLNASEPKAHSVSVVYFPFSFNMEFANV